MKKIIALILALVLVFSVGVATYARTWPENPADWTSEDWRVWNDYWQDYWSKHQRCNPYPCYNNYNKDTSGPGNGYNNSYNYTSYNYYNGILDIYAAETEDQAVILAKIMYLYGHGVASQTQQAAIGWAVMNSVDASTGSVSIGSIAPNFHYDATKPTRDDFGRDLMPLARDVIFRWKAGRAGITSNGRVMPGGYNYVWSNGSSVWFRTTPDESGTPWNFSYYTPYGN